MSDFDKTRIDDVIEEMPCRKAEQTERRRLTLNGIKIEDVPGVTVNRYCASD
jgi:acetyl-CoA acyltransferase